MLANLKINLFVIFLNIPWPFVLSHQPTFHQQPQLFDANQNYFVPNSQQQFTSNFAPIAGQPYGGNPSSPQQLIYQYSTPTSHSQLWSSAPIVVADNTENNGQVSKEYHQGPRNSKALPLTYNNHREIGQQQQQQLPSNNNYANPAVYHSSDVWRHQQQLHQQNPTHLNEKQNSLNYNRQQENNGNPSTIYQQQQQQQQQHLHFNQQQQQHQHSQPDQQQLFASNTDLNYLQATPINHRSSYASNNRDVGGVSGGAAGETNRGRGAGTNNSTADYSQHFKEYLRKHPRRIEPIY